MTKYFSTAETAKLIRKALAESFPGVKFSVRSHNYSGGSSINVSWTDGPTAKMVDSVAGLFSGAAWGNLIDEGTGLALVAEVFSKVRGELRTGYTKGATAYLTKFL